MLTYKLSVIFTLMALSFETKIKLHFFSNHFNIESKIRKSSLYLFSYSSDIFSFTHFFNFLQFSSKNSDFNTRILNTLRAQLLLEFFLCFSYGDKSEAKI